MPDSYTLKDPSTGRPMLFDVPAPDETSINPQALQQLFENQKVDDAEKAMAAAIQFQGLRGYQQALKSGEPAEKALTRYGPMMFYRRPQSFGPAMRALTPPKPERPILRSIPGGGLVDVDPVTRSVKTLREPTATAKPEKFSAVVGEDVMLRPTRLPMTGEQFKTFIQTAPPELRTNTVNEAISKMLQPPVTATNAPAAVPKTKRLRYNVEKGDFE